MRTKAESQSCIFDGYQGSDFLHATTNTICNLRLSQMSNYKNKR
jgi:hypothetical protein